MSDIVERLRDLELPSVRLRKEAADEIERLRAALEPFARADRAIGKEPGPFRFETSQGYRLIERDDLRRAAQALAGEQPNGEQVDGAS